MVIVSEETYDRITDFINKFSGLAIECEDHIAKEFPEIPIITLKSIISKHGQLSTRSFYFKNHHKSAQICQEFYRRLKDEKSMLEFAIELKTPPMSLCRMILNEKYSKPEVKEMLKDPDIIPDPLLSANVFTCLFSDNQDGLIVDMLRYTIGEEYEVKLKRFARDAGLVFYDEGDLRRDGFDKTPDLLLAVPVLYQNSLVNWIESKASFGDIESHNKYLTDQLTSYSNRFGPGIVIYWFGFHENILNKTKNLIILDNFPTAASGDEFEKLTFQ